MNDPLSELMSGDDERAEKAIPAIVSLGEAAIPALLELTHSEDMDIRWWAVRALAASPHVRTRDLLPFLSDPAPEVRSAAALAFSHHPDVDAVSALIQTLGDSDQLTTGLAANALGQIGKPAVSGLLEAGENAPLPSLILIVRALSEIRDHRAISFLMKCLETDSAVLHYWVQQALERLGLDMVYIKP